MNHIKEYRERAGLSQRALAELVGVSYGTISLAERDITKRVKWTTIRDIAKVLGVTTTELMGMEEEETATPKERRYDVWMEATTREGKTLEREKTLAEDVPESVMNQIRELLNQY